MKWINIKDKFPEINQEVIGFRPFAKEHGDDIITVLKYEGYLRTDHKGNTYGFERCHFVSHWMPLPEPAKGLKL